MEQERRQTDVDTTGRLINLENILIRKHPYSFYEYGRQLFASFIEQISENKFAGSFFV